MMPFGMSMGAGSNSLFHQPHHASSALQQQNQQIKNLRRLTTTAAAATAGLAGMHLYRTGKLPLPLLPPRQQSAAGQPLLQIPRELAEVICGAVGEIVQVAVLYPLDTIKVRCQAGGLPVKAVLQQLTAQGASPTTVMRQLYAGVVSASLASVVVGSLYYCTFCAAKRAATKMVANAEKKQAATSAPAAAAAAGLTVATTTSSSSSCSNGSSHAASSPRQFPHGNGLDCHGFDPVFAAICSDDKAAAAAGRQQQSTSAASQQASSSSSSSQAELSSNGKLQANILAACAAAVVGALVEAPVELFKHRAQAGQIQAGAMMSHVASALRQHGPAALYGSFFIPFLFKSLPFDIGELMTYSSLNDWRTAAKARTAAAAASRQPAGVLQDSSMQSHSTLQEEQHQQHQHQQHQQPRSASPALASLTAASLNSSSNSSSGAGLGLPWPPGDVVSNMPDHVWDMAVGATAGAAAVMISMPADCIKTVMETGGGVQPAAAASAGAAGGGGGGPLRSAAAFVGTGKQLVKQHGAGGLFMGVTPRLVESVPSTMLYWLAVEGCRRMLEPYVAPEAAAAAAAASANSS